MLSSEHAPMHGLPTDYRPDVGPEEGSMNGRVESKDKTMTTIRLHIHKFNTRILCLTLLSSVAAAAPLIAADGAATQDAEQAHARSCASRPGQARSTRSRRHEAVRRRKRGHGCRLPAVPWLRQRPGSRSYGLSLREWRPGRRRRAGCLAAGSADIRSVGRRSAIGRRGVRRHCRRPGWRVTPVRRCSRDKRSSSSTARTGMACRAHFELHVWAWRDNPNGAFVDWNNKVSCEGK